MARGNYKAQEMARESRRKTIVANLLAGLSVSEIADALGVARATVYNDVQRVLQRWQDDQVELFATQRLLNPLWVQATAGQLDSVDRVLKILEQRARLLGLYAPAKIAPTNPEGTEAWQPEQAPEDFYADVVRILAEHGGLNGATPPAAE